MAKRFKAARFEHLSASYAESVRKVVAEKDFVSFVRMARQSESWPVLFSDGLLEIIFGSWKESREFHLHALSSLHEYLTKLSAVEFKEYRGRFSQRLEQLFADDAFDAADRHRFGRIRATVKAWLPVGV